MIKKNMRLRSKNTKLVDGARMWAFKLGNADRWQTNTGEVSQMDAPEYFPVSMLQAECM